MKQTPEAILELDAMPSAIPEDMEVLRDEAQRRVVLVKRPRCPYCGSAGVRCYKTTPGGRIRYYQCTRCVLPGGDGLLTRFKAIVE